MTAKWSRWRYLEARFVTILTIRFKGALVPAWPADRSPTRTGPVEADGAVDAQNAPTAPWKTLLVFHELPQGFPHPITHDKPRKSPESYWETRIDPKKTPHSHRQVGWVIPPDHDGGYVARMEDVLTVYQRPYDPTAPSSAWMNTPCDWSRRRASRSRRRRAGKSHKFTIPEENLTPAPPGTFWGLDNAWFQISPDGVSGTLWWWLIETRSKELAGRAQSVIDPRRGHQPLRGV